MIGAIIGDIIGSPYEGSHNAEVNSLDFPLFNEKSRFTDDTVLTIATADALLESIKHDGMPSFSLLYRKWARKYPDAGYGKAFKEWFNSIEPYQNNSYANGCMMRCSPIPLWWKNAALYIVEAHANESIKWTHNSPESARGVNSICAAIHMALNGKSKEEIKSFVEEQYGHMCNASVYEVRCAWPKDTIRCNIYAPQSLIAFLQSRDYESCIRNAVYMMGDTDTTAAIAGSIAEAFYGVDSIPQSMIDEAKKKLPEEMKEVVNTFYERIGGVDPNSPYKNIRL